MQLGNCLDKIIGVVMPAAVTAVAIMEKGLGLFALAEPVSGVIVGVAALAAHLHKQNRNECAAALTRVRNKLEKELERDFAARGMDGTFLQDAFAEIDAVIADARPSIEELVHEWRLDPALVAEGMVAKLASRSRMIRNDPRVRAVATEMVARTVAKIKDDPDLFAKLQPAVAREILSDLSQLNAKVDVLLAESSSHGVKLTAIERHLSFLLHVVTGNASRAAPDAAAAGMMADASLEVARRLTQGSESSRRHSPVRAAIDDIAGLTKAGRLDQAADRVNQAIAEADALGLSDDDHIELLQRAMDVDLLRFDYDGVAARLESLIATEMPAATGAERFTALLDRQRSWHTRDILESNLSGKAYLALHLALAVARRAETPLQVMQSAVAATRSASALGERLKNSWFDASTARSIVRNVRTRAMAQIVQAFGRSNPSGLSEQFVDAVLAYGEHTRTLPETGKIAGFERWELACFAFPLVADGIWSRFPAGLSGVVKLIAMKGFREAIGRAELPDGFNRFVCSDAEAETILNREYIAGPAISHALGMPTGGLLEVFAAQYGSGRAAAASADDLLQQAGVVAANEKSRAAAEVHEWCGRRAFELFWTKGEPSHLAEAAEALNKALPMFDPVHDRVRISEIAALAAEVAQLLEGGSTA